MMLLRYDPSPQALRRYFHILKQDWLPQLRTEGFDGELWQFRRARKDVVECVSVQRRTDHLGCYVNVGVSFLFEKDEWGKTQDWRIIVAENCSIRDRLIRSRSHGIAHDLWPYCERYFWHRTCRDSDVHACAHELINGFRRCAIPFFDQFTNLPEIFEYITVDALRSDRIPKIVAPRGAMGLAYILAQWFAIRGDIRRSSEFAKLGIELVRNTVQSGAANERRMRPLESQLREYLVS